MSNYHKQVRIDNASLQILYLKDFDKYCDQMLFGNNMLPQAGDYVYYPKTRMAHLVSDILFTANTTKVLISDGNHEYLSIPLNRLRALVDVLENYGLN